jgi:hypothetical protein
VHNIPLCATPSSYCAYFHYLPGQKFSLRAVSPELSRFH